MLKPPDYQIPLKYSENYITIMVRDPHSLFTYWEVTGEQKEIIAGLLKKEWDEISLYLRLYEVTGLDFDGTNAHRYEDFAVNGLAEKWYLKNLAANCSYCVDLGTKDENGLFYVIVRSNIVRTPKTTVADVGEGEQVIAHIRQQWEEKQGYKNSTSSSTYYQ